MYAGVAPGNDHFDAVGERPWLGAFKQLHATVELIQILLGKRIRALEHFTAHRLAPTQTQHGLSPESRWQDPKSLHT